MTDALTYPPSDYIDGTFIELPGANLKSTNPASPDDVVWTGSPAIGNVDNAVTAARRALPQWATKSTDERANLLRKWQEVTQNNLERIAGVICDEMGKPMHECLFEAKALGSKVDITLGEYSMARVREYEVPVNETRSGHCRYKPHGVMTVIGPFNFPAHLPNGHFVPAMLMGNTVVFKPSEKTPAVGQLIAELMDEAGVPRGVFNVVQGGADVASKLVGHNDIDGVLFTGSWRVGRKILETNLDRPGRMIALEMGGNNPAVVTPNANFKQAVVECARAGFATTGQRCTCTRRIIVHESMATEFIAALCKAGSTLVIGPGRSEQPVFMGPLINGESVQRVIDFQSQLVDRGGTVRLEATALEQPGHFITPGVVEVPAFELEHDCEIFGPLVQVSTYSDLDDAISQANATKYGLAAAIFTTDCNEYEQFFHGVNAGCINWNTGTAGASSALPFGGTGRSGNHRPAGSFASQYCAYPIANMIETGSDAAVPTGMHWDDSWMESPVKAER